VTRSEIICEEELNVSLTFHNLPAEMLKEFALKIVKPFFHGNMNEAIRSLMQKAIDDETIVAQTIS
jgi:hypothetical protein